MSTVRHSFVFGHTVSNRYVAVSSRFSYLCVDTVDKRPSALASPSFHLLPATAFTCELESALHQDAEFATARSLLLQSHRGYRHNKARSLVSYSTMERSTRHTSWVRNHGWIRCGRPKLLCHAAWIDSKVSEKVVASSHSHPTIPIPHVPNSKLALDPVFGNIATTRTEKDNRTLFRGNAWPKHSGVLAEIGCSAELLLSPLLAACMLVT